VRILLDECIDRRFAAKLPGYEVRTVPQAGWAGIKNGELMRLAENEFEVFITIDRNLSYQQNLPQFNIALIVLKAFSNRVDDLAPLADLVLETLPTVEKGKATLISR
jgi:predicted nuclease of predicted toxin-antitoxin system